LALWPHLVPVHGSGAAAPGKLPGKIKIHRLTQTLNLGIRTSLLLMQRSNYSPQRPLQKQVW